MITSSMKYTGVPVTAIKVNFKAAGGVQADYYIWPYKDGWCWQAMGNHGATKTQAEAAHAARAWIANANVVTRI